MFYFISFPTHQRGPGTVPEARGRRAVVGAAVCDVVAVARSVAVQAGEGVVGGEQEGDGQESRQEGEGEDGQEVDGDAPVGEKESGHLPRLLLYLLILQERQNRLWKCPSVSDKPTCSDCLT